MSRAILIANGFITYEQVSFEDMGVHQETTPIGNAQDFCVMAFRRMWGLGFGGSSLLSLDNRKATLNTSLNLAKTQVIDEQ